MSFSRYPEYQFTGLEVLQNVPANWKVVPAKYLLSFLTSGSRGWAEYYAESGELFFRIANLDRNSIRPKLDSIQHVAPPDRGEGERARIEEGDILVSITADLGSVCCACKKVSGGYVSQHVALARPIEKICDSNWLAYFISGQVAKEQLLGAGYGGTKVQLSLQDIRDLIVSLPSKEEQQKIATFLDYETAKIDALIAEQQRLIELLKEKRQTVISHAVTKGLNPNAPMKDSGVEWLGEVPAHWEVIKLKYVVREKVAGPYGASLTKAMYTNEGYKVYGQQQIISDDFQSGSYYISQEKYNEMTRYTVFPNDVLVTVMGTIGRVSVVPEGVERGIINPRLVRYKFDDGKIMPIFVKLILMSLPYQRHLREESKGSTMEGLNMGILGDVPLLVPPLDEQKEIAVRVTQESDGFRAALSESESLISLLAERRSALISAAVTGKIDVRGWQPSESNSPEPVLQAAEEAASYG